MKATVDQAGRVVIPKALRDQVGIRAGEVDILVDGTSLRIEVEPQGRLIEQDGMLLLKGVGAALTEDDVRELRLADQR